MKTQRFISSILGFLILISACHCFADSVNSPNISLNADTNRSVGSGAGNVAVTINTITIAEISVNEYSSGTGKQLSLTTRPGYVFDTTSTVTAQSATIGFNNSAINVAASITPNGSLEETLTFRLTSGTSGGQDIIRINGIKLKIGSAAGAAGPAQTTVNLTTSAAGGAFTNQGIIAANIAKGAPDHLIFSNQPGNTQAGQPIEPEVKIVDFGGNLVSTDQRNISLAIQTGSSTLFGTTLKTTVSGVAKWATGDLLTIPDAANGYVLRAIHSGANFLSLDSVDSAAFNITAGDPGGMVISTQPANTTAGGDIIVSVSLVDNLGNPAATDGIPITLDSAVNPGGWPLLVDTSLTKETVQGVASWGADDNLRITKAVDGYTLSASGLGTPVTTNAFNIAAGANDALRFVQQPSTLTEDQIFTPPVSVEIIDSFGNRTLSNSQISLALDGEGCSSGALSNFEATAENGLATFPSLIATSPCSDATLFANLTVSASSVLGTVSDAFDIKAKDAFPISIKSAELQKKLFKFQATGPFTVSADELDDPTKNGATLTVTGTTGSVTYALPKNGWKRAGNKGFQFKGKKCESVKLTSDKISAVCASKPGTLKLPESTIDIVLSVGAGTERYCGECGGTSSGNENKKLKRKSCAQPEACD